MFEVTIQKQFEVSHLEFTVIDGTTKVTKDSRLNKKSMLCITFEVFQIPSLITPSHIRNRSFIRHYAQSDYAKNLFDNERMYIAGDTRAH